MKKMNAGGLLNTRGHSVSSGTVTFLSGYLQSGKEKYSIVWGFFRTGVPFLSSFLSFKISFFFIIIIILLFHGARDQIQDFTCARQPFYH